MSDAFRPFSKYDNAQNSTVNYLKKTPENAWSLHALLWKGRCTHASPCSSICGMQHTSARFVAVCLGQARRAPSLLLSRPMLPPPGSRAWPPGSPASTAAPLLASDAPSSTVACRGLVASRNSFVLVMSSRDTCETRRSDSEQQLKRLLQQALCNQRRTERWKGRCTSMGIRVTKW